MPELRVKPKPRYKPGSTPKVQPRPEPKPRVMPKPVSKPKVQHRPEPEPNPNEVSVTSKKRRRCCIIFAVVIGAIIVVGPAIGLGIGLTRSTNTAITTTTSTAATTATTISTCSSVAGSALLLSDTNTATVQTLVNALQSAGLTVNYIPGGISNYTGTPNASTYGSIILISGVSTTDMPISGQQSIVNAQQACGAGVVMTEFAAFQVSAGKWTTLSSLILAPYASGTLGIMTFNLLSAGHPIWTGLASTFTTNATLVWQRFGTPVSGTTIVANCSVCNTNSVFAYPQSGTAGRIVQIGHAGHYMFASNFNWGNDVNVLTMMINSVKWALRLI